MKVFAWCIAVLAAVPLVAFGIAHAGSPDVSSLYSVETQLSPKTVKKGEHGEVSISFHTKKGAHISDEAPLRIQLSGQGVQVGQSTLRYQDSLSKKTPGTRYPDPRFVVPFVAQTKGSGAVSVNMTFFVCTEKVCSRQRKQVTLQVLVD